MRLEEHMPLVGVIFVLSFFFTAYHIKKHTCNLRAISFDNHRYSLLAGCMVEHNGRWLPLENIRGFDDKG